MMGIPMVIGLLLNYRDTARSIECVQSLLDNRIDKVMVWDNSADEGESAAGIKTHFEPEPRVFVNVSDHNLGFAAGVNGGLALCKERFPRAWVLLINNDAYLLPGGLIKLCTALEQNPKSLLAFPDINHAGQICGIAYHQILTGKLSWNLSIGSFAYASGCCLLIANDRLSMNLFDEDFFMYGEDSELGWRLRLKKRSMIHVSEMLVVHEGSASSKLGSSFYEERMVAAHLILVSKLTHNWIYRVLLYGTRVPMLFTRAIIRSVRFRSIIPLLALWNGWKIAFINDPMRQLRLRSKSTSINHKPSS